jgi:flagellar hook-associated protein 2
MAATFSAGGLASGIDTNSIVDQLVKLESRPIDLLRQRQTGIKTQVSTLGQIISRLSALEAAAKDLGDAGVLAARVGSTHDAFGATPGTGALAGRYSVRVDRLAQAAKWRSASFTSATAPVVGGTLQLTVAGTTWDPITITDGMALSDVAFAIRQSGAPVSATVLTAQDGVAYLSVTARDTGYAGTDPSQALSIGFTATGVTGQAPGFAEIQAAQNAAFSVDGVDFVRTGNTVTDAIPGVTLSLKKGAVPPATEGTAEDLVLETDVEASQARLQKLVEAYNAVMSLVQAQLNPTKDTDRSATLAGDSTVRSLQASLQRLIVTSVPGQPTVSTLADLGVKTARDGSLSIDATAFAAALARDPGALDALFSTATTGLSAVVSGFVQGQVRAGDGLLSTHKTGLDAAIRSLDDQAAALQRRVDAFREGLVRQFAAMESAVSAYKSIGTFLTNQAAQTSSK